MDNISGIFETMINSFDNDIELMNFAATWGLQDSPAVRLRLFQLRNPEYGSDFVAEELHNILQNLGRSTEQPIDDFELALEYVREQEQDDNSCSPLSSDKTTDDSALCNHEDSRLQIQTGSGPQQGSSSYEPSTSQGLKYTIQTKSERKYAKNAAVDRTYQIKLDEKHQGQRLQDIRQGLYQMFNDTLHEARGSLAGNDLGRVVIHHNGLHDPIVVPLQPWDQLNADTVMGAIEKVLNSNQNLGIDESFDISIGSIDLPKGGARRRITTLNGDNNSLQLKKSIVTIANEDQLCMARAIGVSWAKLRRCSPLEWSYITTHRAKKTNIDLILEHHKVPESVFKQLRNKARNEQRQLALAISRLANVPVDRPASLNDLNAFEDALGVRVMVVSARLGNRFVTRPSTDKRPCIYIYFVDNHFHAITSITGFFSAIYFCENCLKHYDHRENHECESTCIVCKTDQCPKTDTPVTCDVCNMTCRSMECYEKHQEVPVYKKGKKKGQVKDMSQCRKWFKCHTCYKVLNTTVRLKEEHQCGEYYCSSCEQYVLQGHLCYLRAIPVEDIFIPKFIFFDFECSQDKKISCIRGYLPSKIVNCKDCRNDQICKSCMRCQHCRSPSCGRATHIPNFVVAHTVCPLCKDRPLNPESRCKGCGTRCRKCETEDKGPCPNTCGFRETVFEGADVTDRFGNWLFSFQHKNFKVVAHNMKGYDGYFLLEYLIDNSMRPGTIIYSGSKIMYMTVEKGLNITIIDSLNFLPMKLSALPKVFGLKELKKGWFPHLFNVRENQHYVGPYPEPEYYGHDFMGDKERQEFLEWHQSKKDEVFDFREEILDYCRSDVDILRQACLQFQQLLMSATGEEKEVINAKGKKEMKWFGAVNPFDSVTIASVCMNVYRSKFLEEKWRVKLENGQDWVPAKLIDGRFLIKFNNDWKLENEIGITVTEKEFVSTPIARIPPCGYNDQYSKVSIQWLEWMAKQHGVNIQHALNGGEKWIPGTRYKLDGYCEDTNTVYEFQGCVFHGCPECFPEGRENIGHPLTKQSMTELYALTKKKQTHLERLGMKYICIWEHQFQEQIKNNPELKAFVENLDIEDRLDPRDSFFGGRTNASQLYYKSQEQEQIKYVDFTSLYPWVNKYCEYPVGHPKIIVKDFRDIGQYFGIAKVRIVPPRGLYHPVLPYRSNGKLKFPLCQKCADSENQDPCECSEEDRALTGTWCTPEIQTATRLGYKLLKIYEVYHWEETTKYDRVTGEGGLFANYINTFLKFKQEASGPPDWIQSEEDMNTYIRQYFEKEGVTLNVKNIVLNPGLRALAKLCLNSFWGKFGQRLNMRQTEFFDEDEANEFFQIFTDPMKQPQNFHILSNDILQLEWIHKTKCQPEDNKTNIYLATFTTCWARLKLYSVLERLDRRVLYYDTDSVIYVSREGQYDPPLGDYLGDLTNELGGGEHIVEFVSGGPKNYAYKTNKNKETCKVRGFTLHYTNSQLINFESVKALVTDATSPQTITVENPGKICRDKLKRKIYNREEQKTYQMVYTKRRKLDNFDTVPYGF